MGEMVKGRVGGLEILMPSNQMCHGAYAQCAGEGGPVEKWPQIIAHFGPLCAALAKQIIITFSICFFEYIHIYLCLLVRYFRFVFFGSVSIAPQIKISHAFPARTT